MGIAELQGVEPGTVHGGCAGQGSGGPWAGVDTLCPRDDAAFRAVYEGVHLWWKANEEVRQYCIENPAMSAMRRHEVSCMPQAGSGQRRTYEENYSQEAAANRVPPRLAEAVARAMWTTYTKSRTE